MKRPLRGIRALLMVVYLLACLPVLMMVGISVPGLGFLFMLDIHFIRALPLHLLFRAFGDAEIALRFGLDDMLLTGLLLWPLLLLAIRQGLWQSKSCRWSIYSYSVLWIAGTFAASMYYYKYPFLDM